MNVELAAFEHVGARSAEVTRVATALWHTGGWHCRSG